MTRASGYLLHLLWLRTTAVQPEDVGSLPWLGDVTGSFPFADSAVSKAEHIFQRHTDRDRTLTQPATKAALVKGCFQQHLCMGLVNQ